MADENICIYYKPSQRHCGYPDGRPTLCAHFVESGRKCKHVINNIPLPDRGYRRSLSDTKELHYGNF